MFSHNEASEDRHYVAEGMALLAKMVMWENKDSEDHSLLAEGEALFEAVANEEDDAFEEINLPKYHKVIFDSQAYKWFLSSIRKEVSLKWEGSDPRILTESLRWELLGKLPTETISRCHFPSSHDVTFILGWDESMELRLQREDVHLSAWPAQSFSSFITLTGSPEEAQALTITQYMDQTWPTNGLQMLNAIKEAIASPRSGKAA